MLLQRLARPLKEAVSHGLAPARRIHLPGRLQLTAPTDLSQQAQSVIHRIIGRLEGAIHGQTAARSFRTNAASYRSSYSLPTRLALSKPLSAPCLPRAPRVPRHITQVGLGTARNFSTGRPIFQNLVQNVPVAGRAFYEVDWDLKMREDQRNAVRMQKKAAKQSKQAPKLTLPLPQPIIPASSVSVCDEEDMQHYFESAEAPSVITYLQVPLAPTPTARVPLSAAPVPHLLPLSALAKEHALHSKHSIRVNSLFRRLDAAEVWERGASCEAYGDPSGLCTVLQVKFDGWTEEMVRAVIGDAGRDWCTVQEICPLPVEPSIDASVPMIYNNPWTSPSLPMEESQVTLIIPTLDFSTTVPLAEEPHHDATSDQESEFFFVAGSDSGWESDMGDFSTPPTILSELNAEEDWSSVGRIADAEVPVGFTSNFQGAMLFH